LRSVGLVMVLALAGCAGRTPVGPQVSASLDDSFVLHVGEQVTFGSEPLRLFFDEVVEDSRCPLQVTCVWEGNARLALRAQKGDSSALLDLNTRLEPRAATVLGYEVALERLEPQKIGENRIPQERYSAYLRVTKP
jgi:hypothetical protein